MNTQPHLTVNSSLDHKFACAEVGAEGQTANFVCAPGKIFALVDGLRPTDQTPGTWLLWDLHQRIESCDPDSLDGCCVEVELQATSHHVLLLIDYELGYWLEPVMTKITPKMGRPPFTALVFKSSTWMPQSVFDEWLERLIDETFRDTSRAGVADLRPSMSFERYCEKVSKVLDEISAGNCYQINFTWPIQFQSLCSSLTLYRSLRARQPVRYGGMVRLADRDILCLSPELFLEKSGSRITARPMKGTAARGVSPDQDAQAVLSLQQSEKQRAENLMIVDLLRNDLGRIAVTGSVRVQSLCAVETYPTVHQLVSTITAEILPLPLARILSALFPCGSITGAPKIRAMQVIRDLEDQPRGLYTGSLGHLRPGGDFVLNVAIRTLELSSQGLGRLGVGSGLVADSDPGTEYAECLLKAGFLIDLPVNFEIIETMFYSASGRQPLPLLACHLRRLASSARYFGFRFDERRITSALLCKTEDKNQILSGLARLRLSRSGDFVVEIRPLPRARQTSRPRIVLAREKSDSHDLFLRHKTSIRELYDRALADLSGLPGYFDALFFNERDELTEGARSNVFVQSDGVWYTPPLSSGLLPGIQRSLILQNSGTARERVLHLEDLQAAKAICLSNAVRGVFQVDWDQTPGKSQGRVDHRVSQSRLGPGKSGRRGPSHPG